MSFSLPVEIIGYCRSVQILFLIFEYKEIKKKRFTIGKNHVVSIQPFPATVSVVVFLWLLSGLSSQTKAQTVEASVDLSGVASNFTTTPFWLQSNRHGIYSDKGNMLLERIQVYGKHEDLLLNGKISFYYGADLIARSGTKSNSLSFNQFFFKMNAYGAEIAAGRFLSPSPIYNDQLGIGALGVSGNAVPVPKVQLSVNNWTDVPGTKGYAEIVGHLAHGWMTGNRFTDNVLYHEKVGYTRFGGDLPVNIFAGLSHYVLWGGSNNPRYGDLPSKFSDFWRVFFALHGDDNAPPTDSDFMLGDHLGFWDFGLTIKRPVFSATFYRQHPIETKDNLKLKSLQDALNGLLVDFDPELQMPLRSVLYEFMYTKWQDGPRTPNVLNDGTPCSQSDQCRDNFQGNENYYNHGIYRSGWTSHGRTIGNPLFRVADPAFHRTVTGVDNNRIIAHHIGAIFQFGKTNLTGKITKSRNFGTRDNPFSEPKEQLSIGLFSETGVRILNHTFVIFADTAWDIGDLFGNQIGVLLGIRWQP